MSKKGLKKFLKKNGYYAIPIIITAPNGHMPAGHLFVSVKLNGKKALFMLDTGASVSVLDKSSVKKFKVKTGMEEDTEINALSASGLLNNIDFSTENKLKLGKIKFQNVPLLIMDLSHLANAEELSDLHIDGVLGSDILYRGKAIIDYSRFYLFLKPEK